MSLKMLVAELLEVVKNLFLNDRGQALHLFDKDTLAHLNGAHVTKRLFYNALGVTIFSCSKAVSRAFLFLLCSRCSSLIHL